MKIYMILDYDYGGGSSVEKIFFDQKKAIKKCEELKQESTSPECIQLEIFETED